MVVPSPISPLFVEVREYISANLHQRYLAQLCVVLCRQDTLLGVEQTLLCFAHIDTGQITKQITLHSNIVILFGCNEVLSLLLFNLQIVEVCLPEVGQISRERLLNLLACVLCVLDLNLCVTLLAAAVAVKDCESEIESYVRA